MAASVAYKINGSANVEPISKTKEALEKVSKAAGAMKTAFTGFAIAKVFQGVNAVVNGATSAFKNMNTALSKSNQAFSQNASLTKESVENIRDALSEFSAGNFFDGDSLNNASSLASQMGLNEEQIKSVMDAATEMAASGIMPLDQAVKKLSESFQGSTGDLAKLCPELKNLTEEQLKSGAAVEAMKKKYDGFRDAISNTFEGRDKQWANSFGDLQASVGGIISAFEFLAKGEFMKPLQDLGTWISDHQKQIINFALHLPDVFQEVGKAIVQIFSRLFTNSGVLELGKFITDSVKNWIPVIQAYFTGVGEFLYDVFNATFGNVARAIYNVVIIPVKQWFADIINDFIKKHPKVVETLKTLSGGKITIEEIKVDSTKKEYADISKAAKDYSKAVDKATAAAQEASAKQKEITSTFTARYKDITDTASANISKILNQDLPEELENAFNAGADAIGNAVATSAVATSAVATNTGGFDTDIDKTMQKVGLLQNALNSVLSSFGDIGTLLSGLSTQVMPAITAEIQKTNESYSGQATVMQLASAAVEGLNAAMKSNIFGLILSVIVQIIGTFNSAMSEASESFNKVINLFSTIIQPIVDKIAPLVEDLFKPFADILEDIGTIIGEMIYPIMELANDVLVPIMNGFSSIFDMIARIAKTIAPIASTFMKFLNSMNIFAIVFKGIAKVIELIGLAIGVLYNKVLRPIANFLIKMIEKVANGFVWVYNKIIGVFNGISIFGKHPFHFNKANEVNIGELAEMDLSSDVHGESDSDSSGNNASGTASYTAQRDVYVNIYFEHSYVNGDSQQIAIMLAREIQNAEKMNLV